MAIFLFFKKIKRITIKRTLKKRPKQKNTSPQNSVRFQNTCNNIKQNTLFQSLSGLEHQDKLPGSSAT